LEQSKKNFVPGSEKSLDHIGATARIVGVMAANSDKQQQVPTMAEGESPRSANGSLATAITPRQLADRWQVDVAKIHRWIHSGELAALNLAARSAGKPRFRITHSAIADFEERRKVRGSSRRQKRCDCTMHATGTKEHMAPLVGATEFF